MSMMIIESLASDGKCIVDFNYKEPKTQLNLKENNHTTKTMIDPSSIMVEVEGIHEFPFATRNFTRYHKEALVGSMPSWTKPYQRPLILHHNEKDGKIIGRVQGVEYVTSNTLSKTPALMFTVNVPDKEAEKQIKNGILNTVSIGAIVNSCKCSICGQDIALEGECEHERGGFYDGEICYWDVYDMEAKELSYVIVPSDIYAQNKKVYSATGNSIGFSENKKKGVLDLAEQSNINNQGTVINENGEKGVNRADIEAKYAELKVNYDNLKIKFNELEKSEDGELKEKVATLTKELNDAKVLLSQAQKSLTNAENSLTLKEADLLREKGLRESLEKDFQERELSLKESLLDNIGILRKSLNKPVIAKESLQGRSLDSLNDTINDLKEELNIDTNQKGSIDITEGASDDVTTIQEASNEGIVKNTNNFKAKEVKEQKEHSNISVEEGMKSFFDKFDL